MAHTSEPAVSSRKASRSPRCLDLKRIHQRQDVGQLELRLQPFDEAVLANESFQNSGHLIAPEPGPLTWSNKLLQEASPAGQASCSKAPAGAATCSEEPAPPSHNTKLLQASRHRVPTYMKYIISQHTYTRICNISNVYPKSSKLW